MKVDSRPVPLASLRVGDFARLDHTAVEAATERFLRAVGMTRTAQFRVCRHGEPCIIQVRSTRVAIARALADNIFVLRVAGSQA